MHVWKLGAPALFAIWAGACGADDSGRPRPSQDEYNAFLDRYCGDAISCCSKIGRDPSTLSVQSCKTQLASRYPGYDPDAGATCLNQLDAARSGNGSCWPASEDPSDPCNRIFAAHYGSAQAGEGCADDSDCVLPENGTSMCGHVKRCQMQLYGKAGDAPCIAESSNIPGLGEFTLFFGDGSIPTGYICRSTDGVYCEQKSFPTGGCVPVKGLGEPCGVNIECATGFCESGHCANPRAVGESCSGTRCVAEAYCKFDSTTATCLARQPLGSPCADSEECSNGDCRDASGKEVSRSAGGQGTCAPMTQELVVGLLCL